MMESENAVNHVVAIVEDSEGCTVAPGQILAAVGDYVVFRNLTSHPVMVIFPDKNLFSDITTVNLDPEEYKRFEVTKAELGSYPYMVYRSAKKEVAHASVPTIIIYRS